MNAAVVCTGRCGSKSLGIWLAGTGLDARVEPAADKLIRCSMWVAHRVGGWHAQAREVIEDMPGDVVVDNNLSLFVRDIAASSREVKFVWLIRNGWSCVSSLMAWKWYRHPDDIAPDDVFANHRMRGDLAGEMLDVHWKDLSPFGRCCWYWSFLNRKIAEQFRTISGDRKRMIRLEDWSPAVARDLCAFLGAEMPRQWDLPHTNSGIWNDLRPEWTPAEVRIFDRFCGNEMARWYTEHRYQTPWHGLPRPKTIAETRE